MKENKRDALIIVGALLISVIVGIILQNNIEVALMFQPLGTIYINLIKMIMVPLVLSSLILGISSISDIKKIGKMGIWTIGIFLGTTAGAVVIGLILSNVFKPGKGISIENATYAEKVMPSIVDQIVNVFPNNILNAMLEANMLQIIFIALVIGIGLVKIAPKGKIFRDLTQDVFDIMIWLTKVIMKLTPFGILGLMIPTVAQNGIRVLLPLGKLILVFYLAVAIQVGIIYVLLLKSLSDFSIKEFIKAMLPAQIIAFMTCSSAAALPVSLQRAQENLNISKEVSGFVLSLGNTINMDGNALYQGIVVLFIAQAYGVNLSLIEQLVVVLTGTLASIGAAGVPGAGMIVLSTVLASVGLPIDGIALVAGIDRILDMGRTLTNVTGDVVTACVVNKFMRQE